MTENFQAGRYAYAFGERVTPVDEIPVLFRRISKLPNGQIQITDSRICYTFHPEYSDANFPYGAFLECENVAYDDIP